MPVLAGQPGKPAVLSRTVQRRPLYSIRDDRYKLIHDTARGAEELYDVVADPAESRNLVASDPLRAAFYREALLEWISEAPRGERQAEEKTRLTAEECEGLQALGYVGVPGCAE
jgi:arylsulfatase A-like enzyme